MNPLKVALFVKPGAVSAMEREERNMGWWSYDVPEFTWQHVNGGGTYYTRDYKDYDLLFWEDGGTYGFIHDGGPPVVYLSIDDTLGDPHYFTRLHRAQHANLILVDHGPLSRFASLDKPVRRLCYCVNDHVYRLAAKNHDISYHCASRHDTPGGIERMELRRYLDTYAKSRDYTYQSGVRGLHDYAIGMATAKVVVNLPRSVRNRPHRVFDAMACGAALVTGPLPVVDGDGLEVGKHYLDFPDKQSIDAVLDRMIGGGEWTKYAAAGYALVKERHTWSVRAAELRQILSEEFGL